jgi:two-component system KDP operon response regulator KdpE
VLVDHDRVALELERANRRLRRTGLWQRAATVDAQGGAGPLTIGDLTIDTAARTVKRAGEAIRLTPTEWDLLRAFLRHSGKTLTHRQLFQAVWATSSGDPQAYLRVYVANLRRKLEPDAVRPRLIITEPGVGYRFDVAG